MAERPGGPRPIGRLLRESGDHPIILFDGVCNLCNRSVAFILAHEAEPAFRFATLQSRCATELLEALGSAPPDLSSVLLVESGRLYDRSTAALRIAARLRAPWRWLRGAGVLPTPLRDTVYDLIGSRRYRWFGRTGACAMPGPQLRDRFLE